jgi:glycosyltransferase involved in cell wall biosynthesis
VVIPVLNRESFIAGAIESVLEQDYEPVELIVVDGGSVDKTPEIAGSFPEVIYEQQNDAGVTESKNAGLRLAHGEFIGFFDSDDLMLSHKLSRQVGYLVEHPDIACVLARHRVLVEPGTQAPTWARDSVFGDPGGVDPVSAVYRKASLESVGGFNTSFRMAEGMELFARMKEAGLKISVLDEVVYRRRVHESNVSHDRRKMASSLLRSLKSHVDRERSNG